MKPGYRLAFELGIPFVLQPEWKESLLLRRGNAGNWEQGYNHYRKAIIYELGANSHFRINWVTGEVTKNDVSKL